MPGEAVGLWGIKLKEQNDPAVIYFHERPVEGTIV